MNTLDWLESLPWTYIGPTAVREEGCPAYFELRIAELPGFLVAAESLDEVNADAKEVLRAFLDAYVERGRMPTLPGQAMVMTMEPTSRRVRQTETAMAVLVDSLDFGARSANAAVACFG